MICANAGPSILHKGRKLLNIVSSQFDTFFQFFNKITDFPLIQMFLHIVRWKTLEKRSKVENNNAESLIQNLIDNRTI